jgi:hypothetical protein
MHGHRIEVNLIRINPILGGEVKRDVGVEPYRGRISEATPLPIGIRDWRDGSNGAKNG